jgi:glycosyltransferase involved in cell wall biosynthesis
LFASLLTEGLVQRGHHVTLFATGDSCTDATLSSVVPHGWSEDPEIDAKVVECLHIAAVFERADDFDIIHNSFDFLPLTYSDLVETSVVTTIHGFSSPRILPVYEKYNGRTAYVAISDADRHPRLDYAATVHHGIDTDAFELHAPSDPYLLFYGRIHPDKGTAHAIEVARLAGLPLVIAGIVHDQQYFDEAVAPHIDDHQVRYIGPVGANERSRLLGGALRPQRRRSHGVRNAHRRVPSWLDARARRRGHHRNSRRRRGDGGPCRCARRRTRPRRDTQNRRAPLQPGAHDQ